MANDRQLGRNHAQGTMVRQRTRCIPHVAGRPLGKQRKPPGPRAAHPARAGSHRSRTFLPSRGRPCHGVPDALRRTCRLWRPVTFHHHAYRRLCRQSCCIWSHITLSPAARNTHGAWSRPHVSPAPSAALAGRPLSRTAGRWHDAGAPHRPFTAPPSVRRNKPAPHNGRRSRQSAPSSAVSRSLCPFYPAPHIGNGFRRH